MSPFELKKGLKQKGHLLSHTPHKIKYTEMKQQRLILQQSHSPNGISVMAAILYFVRMYLGSSRILADDAAHFVSGDGIFHTL